MNAILQNINQGRTQDIGAQNVGLPANPAAINGSTNDCVLLWDVANQTVQGEQYTSVVNSLTLGTAVTLRKSGVYDIELGAVINFEASLMILGISQDATNLTTDFVIGDTGALLATGIITTVTQNNMLLCKAKVFVSPQQQGGTVIRFHASSANGPAFASSAMLTPLTTYYRIKWSEQNHI